MLPSRSIDILEICEWYEMEMLLWAVDFGNAFGCHGNFTLKSISERLGQTTTFSSMKLVLSLEHLLQLPMQMWKTAEQFPN